jgi:hypothetical protein
LTFSVTATDTAGNESPATPAIVFSIERLAPNTPSNFTVA